MSSLITEFLRQAGGAAVIDGGLATELERHGADLNDPLWSAKCLLASPYLIRQVLCSFQENLLQIQCCNRNQEYLLRGIQLLIITSGHSL